MKKRVSGYYICVVIGMPFNIMYLAWNDDSKQWMVRLDWYVGTCFKPNSWDSFSLRYPDAKVKRVVAKIENLMFGL